MSTEFPVRLQNLKFNRPKGCICGYFSEDGKTVRLGFKECPVHEELQETITKKEAQK